MLFELPWNVVYRYLNIKIYLLLIYISKTLSDNFIISIIQKDLHLNT